MEENKAPQKSKAIKAGIIAFFVLVLVVFGIDIILNIANGAPAFTMPKVTTLIVNAVLIIGGTYSIVRNVYNGRKWYK